MKNGLLICSGTGKNKNMGDFIQSLAQEQFLPKVDCFVEREKMDEFESTERVNVIMNGWFMRHPEKFPPSEWINPLFVSFHIVPRNARRMLTPEVLSYLKKYQPIGARDTGTCELLQSYGIDSYFSGCLTLTLGLNYQTEEKSDKIYFVDPYYELGKGKQHGKAVRALSALWYVVKYYDKIKKINKSFQYEFGIPLKRIWENLGKKLMLASFYHSYSSLFSDEVLANAEYVTHKVKQSLFKNDDEKMDYARDLMNKYARAKFVVTSRIHCALPCLGVETPVLFVCSEALEGDKVRSAGRFGGLMELFHVLRWTPKELKDTSDYHFSKENKIEINSVIKNKDDFKKYKESLIKKVDDFLKNNP